MFTKKEKLFKITKYINIQPQIKRMAHHAISEHQGLEKKKGGKENASTAQCWIHLKALLG